jgi:hypothetical protein
MEMMGLKRQWIRTGHRALLECALLCVFLVGTLLWPPMGSADEVVLTTGERFTSSKVWKEDGKIRFNMHGLVVSVNPSDVAAIIGDDNARQSTDAPPLAPQPAPAPPEGSLPPAAAPDRPSPDPAPPPAHNPLPAWKDQPPPPSKHNGIGLNGVTWLMTPSDITGLEKMVQDPAYGGIDQYWRPQEPMQLGPALLDGKVYGFWRNRLYTITMWAEGRIGYARLRDAVFDHYGPGRKNSTGLERYVWIDLTTDRMLEFDTERNTGFFWMRSRELDTQIKKLYPDE